MPQWLTNIQDIKKKPINFKEKIDIFNKLSSIISDNDKVLLTVSGWPDSMFSSCLIYDFFLKNKFKTSNLTFIHCNHKTRRECNSEQRFVEKFFKWTNLKVVINSSKSKSESERRKRRYWQFTKIKSKIIVFGHNQTDRIESTFLNLLRWADLNWFISMDFVQDHHLLPWKKIIRPLIWLNKNYITNLCRKNLVPFVQDASNLDPKISLRNRLRNNIFPQLFKLSHKTSEDSNTFLYSFQKVYDSIDKLKNNDTCLPVGMEKLDLIDISTSPHWKAKFAYKRHTSQKNINSDEIIQLLNQLWIYQNIKTSTIQEITKFLQKSSQWYKYLNWTYFFVSHSIIYIIWAPKFFWEKQIDKSHTITKLWKINFDWKIIEIMDKGWIWMTLRYPQSWDKFKNKTWNSRCINAKIPIFRRNFTPIIVKKNKVYQVQK